MECEEARKILVTPMRDVDPLRAAEAGEHLLHCPTCFSWSLKESEKMRQERGSLNGIGEEGDEIQKVL